MEKRKDRYYYGRRKQWHEAFSTHQHLEFYDPHVLERQKNINPRGSTLDIFLEDLEQGRPSIQAKEIRTFCQPLQQYPPVEAVQGAHRAWLDDREHGTGHTRKYKNRLTAQQLRIILSQPRLGSSYMPNVDRRLIYITDPDPEYLLALAETTPFCELDILRDTTWKHLALQTELRVSIRPTGYPLWKLDFHLPYAFLLQHTQSSHTTSCQAGKTRRRTDLSFLDISTPSDRSNCVYGIQSGHVSLSLCGADDFRYTGYLFVDSRVKDDYEHSEGCMQDEDDDTNEEDDIDEIGDPLASDFEGGTVVEANRPVWNPREYFFLVLSSRMNMISSEWTNLVRFLEVGVRTGEEMHGMILIHNHHIATPQNFTDAVKWVSQATYVVEQLRAHLSTTTAAWKAFDVKNGDIDYFDDLNTVWLHIEMVRRSFRELENLQVKLDEMSETCKTLSQSLTLFMNLESNRLNLASNSVNSQSYDLIDQTVQLNHETNSVALKIHKINRIAFLVNQLFIPVGIAAILLGSEHNPLQLQRDAKTFWVCVFGLIFITLAFTIVNHFVSYPVWLRLFFKSVRSSIVMRKDESLDRIREKQWDIDHQIGQMSLDRAYTV